ncbi:MAG: UDP-N-acetylmuramate--L-alanine ligase, partial [Candidatus Omnitrophica bacterium]|nr:UDP-N-acetylmuramate--L-alanine ligase [Candidatus Omnitrophota bacterium]
MLENKKRIHLIGCGGIGLSAIGHILLKERKILSGSDIVESNLTKKLEKEGMSFFLRQRAENITKDIELVIISVAIGEDNLELKRAKELRIPVITYAEALGLAMKKKFGIAVAGTHGKTTTTALITTILKEAGEEPNFVIGGEVKELGGNSGVGKSNFLIAEACEFKRNFLTLRPKVAVVTNIEEDHLDYYRNLKEIEKAFVEFVSLVPPDGFLVLSEEAKKYLLSKTRAKVFTYGLGEENDYQATGISLKKDSTEFNVLYQKKISGSFSLKIPGKHNILNSLAAFATGDQLGIGEKIIKNALGNFKGVDRRFEIKGEIEDITIIDDYGHHPTEIRATLSAVKQRYPDSRVIAIFQPHQYSRTRFLLDDFARAFKKADLIVVPDIY